MKQTRLERLYDRERFQEQAQSLLELLGKHLDQTQSGTQEKVLNWNNPENELQFWKDFAKQADKGFTGSSLTDFFSNTLAHTIHTHHPRYVGHQVTSPAPPTSLTAMLGALLNNGMAVYEMGMAPTALERIVTDRLCEKIGYDQNSRGLLTSGGTLANLTALLMARQSRVSYDVWQEGLQNRLGILVSEEAHYCVDRAAKIMGLGEAGILSVPVTKDYAMDTEALKEVYQKARAEGIEVFALVGSAPSTATGVYDPLEEQAAFAKENGLWFHVDAAHGGAAIFSEDYKHLMKGAEQADSVVIDGHKMMLMPTLTTALLYKNGQDGHQTFSQKASYLLEDTTEEDWYNGAKRTFECTKTMTSLHWYLLMELYGIEVFDEYVTRQYDLGRSFAAQIQADPDFELGLQPQSNIVCFRYVKEGETVEELNRLNAQIRQKALETGRFYLVQTRLKEKQFLRCTLMNPFTTPEHLQELLDHLRP